MTSVTRENAVIITETEDGITGRAWCSRCGGSVHRASNYCRHCGVMFKGVDKRRKEHTNETQQG